MLPKFKMPGQSMCFKLDQNRMFLLDMWFTDPSQARLFWSAKIFYAVQQNIVVCKCKI